MSYMGSLDLAWHLVKLKSSSNVVGRDMEPKGRGAVGKGENRVG